ncbi:MAG: methyltransferase family protein [Fidelibacterota bacterium]
MLFRSRKTDKQDSHQGSPFRIWIIIFISIFLAVLIANTSNVPLWKDSRIEYFGLFLIYTGIGLRLAVIKSLGTFFTVDVTIKQNHRLKKNGFFKYVRHPSYAFSLLSFIGFGISLNNWLSLIIVFILILTAFILRINVEEKVLTDHFGSEYSDYKEATRAIIPFIY